MDFKCGIFDMDGTLIDSMPMWRGLGRGVLGRRGLEPRPDFGEAMKPLTMREGCAYCKTAYNLPETTAEIIEECFGVVREFYRTEAAPLPGVPEFLAKMKARGAKLYVATATDRPLAEVALRATGLDRYFDGLLTCAEVGVGKQAPDIYEQTLALSGCAKEDSVVFEDALHAIRTAKRAGFRVAAIHDPALTDSHDEIHRLADCYVETYEDL